MSSPADLGFGTTREVWYAKLSDPNTKYSFRIRDDAFTKSGAVFGRTVRLGEPLNTGPGSGWRQMSWEGGSLQHDWRDEQMFMEGSADVWSHVGRIRMWPGWTHLHKDATRKFDSYVFGNGNDGPAIGNTKLYFAERNYFYVAGAPSGGFKAYKYDPDAGTVTTMATTPSTLGSRGYTAITPAMEDGSSTAYIYFGTGGGLWLYHEPDNTWFQDTGATYPINHDSLVPFRDGLYYCSGTSLVKRTPKAGSFGIIGTHTIVKTHSSSYACQGLTVWNNRLWYGVNFQGNKCMLGTSDGVSAQTVVSFPEEFQILRLVSHYGSLYIFGEKPQAVAGELAHQAAVSQVWKYTGSSLTKLWESNDEDQHALTDGKPHIASSACTFGPLLCWGNPGYVGTVTPRAGIMMYDAEKDAIFEGPHLVMDPSNKEGLAITGCHGFDNTLVVSYHDFHSYVPNGATGVDWPNGVSFLRWPNKMRDKSLRLPNTFKGRSVDYASAERMEYVLSSRFRGDDSVQSETKTWLSGEVIVRLADAGSKLRVYAVLNERENYLVKTIEYDATQTGWRKVKFPLKDPGSYYLFNTGPAATATIHVDGVPLTVQLGPSGTDPQLVVDATNSGQYLQSEFIQYRFELVNTDQGHVDSTATPEVDAWSCAWMVAPTKRLQWHIRHVLQDAQDRLAGTANPLTTAQAMADKLEELWSESLPFRMWGPFAEAVDPTTLTSSNCTEVIPTADAYSVQQYRLEDPGTEVAQESAMTLIENITE